jgi:DNA-binding transcriptional MerR regulator
MIAIESDEDNLTIDQLAQLSGVTVRNIRAHQAGGLLPPPEVRARTGYYSQDHLARLRMITELQTEGLNLKAIKKILDATPVGAASDALNMRRSVLGLWEDEEPIIISTEEIRQRFGGDNPGLLARAERLGLLRDLGEERYEVSSPSLLDIADELVRHGLPMEDVMMVGEKLRKATDAIARAFVELFEEGLWRPFDERGRPASEWPRVRDALERTRPLAGQATIANLRRSMARAVEETVARGMFSPRR